MTPRIDVHYHFEKPAFKRLLLWLNGIGGKNLWVAGPTGCGKSSLIEQVAARTGQAVYRHACHGRTEMSELIGHLAIQKDGSMEFQRGPLIRAMLEGAIFILDEGDTLHPSVALGLNGVLDGAGYLIPETGELILPHSCFRICITGNSIGMGEAVEYRATQRQNLAFLDRFKKLLVTYLKPLEEVQILNSRYPQFTKMKDGGKLISAIVETAAAVREGFLAESGDGKLDVTLSTRRVCAWAESTLALGDIEEALRAELTDGVPRIQADAIHAILAQYWSKS